MSKELMCILLTQMHMRLNKLIESNNYDLQSDKVQRYSQRLDRVLSYYDRTLEKNKNYSIELCNKYKHETDYATK